MQFTKQRSSRFEVCLDRGYHGRKFDVHPERWIRLKRVAKKAVAKRRVKKDDLSSAGEEHLRRVRRLCGALPLTTEKMSHGEPTFIAGKKVYAMFPNNHHNDGHIAVWIPV